MAKSKWKSLRDNYRREFKKILKLKMLNKAAVSGWMHFYSLGFLEQVLDKKQIHSQVMHESEISRIQNATIIKNYHDDDDDIETIVIEPSDEESNFVNDNVSCGYDYVKQQQDQQKIRFLNQQKMHQQPQQQNCCPHPAGDEIMHFFKSITPYLSMMEPTMKLKVRIDIQEIILNELSRKIENERKLQSLKTDINSNNNANVYDNNKKQSVKTRKKTEVIEAPKRVSKRIVKKNRKYFEK